MNGESSNAESRPEDKEGRKEREIKLTYKSLSLDLYDEFINIAASLGFDNFEENYFEMLQDNADLAERVSSDEDNEEKNMGPVTLTFRFKATGDEFDKIQKVIDENFAPSIYERQQEIVDNLLKGLEEKGK